MTVRTIRRLVTVCRAATLALAACILATAGARAEYPDKLVRIVVPYAAGGNLDLIARLMAQSLSEAFGQPFIVENRPGANGNIGAEQVARAAPDGYTLALLSAGTMAINPHLYTAMPFDPLKDFTPISLVASGPLVLSVNPTVPVHSVGELIAYAKSHPGALNFGTGGNGTLGHLSTEMLKSRAAINLTHVPYRGNALALNDLVAGQVQVMFDTLSTSIPHVKSGRLRALAVTGTKRSTTMPDLPTIAESGVAGFSAEAWAGLVGPPSLPPEIANRLQAVIPRVMMRDEVLQKLAALGSEPVGSTPQAFRDVIVNDSAKWAEVVRLSGARMD